MSLGYYLTFNGTVNQYGALASAASYAYTSGTIECRFKTTADTTTGNVQRLFIKDGTYGLYLTSNQLVAYNSGATSIYSGITVNDGKWHHAAFTFTGTSVSPNNVGYLYLDGVLVNTLGFTVGVTQTVPLSIGQYFNGSIDEVRIWSSVLSAATILSNYTSVNVSTTSSGLTGYWKLNEGSGTVANNSVSGQPYDFTLIGSPTWTPAPDYAVNGTNLSTMFYLNSSITTNIAEKYLHLSLVSKPNDVNNANTISVSDTGYKIGGVDISNNLINYYQEFTTAQTQTITISSWCTSISAILIGGGGGGGGGGAAFNDRDVDNNGGNGGGGGSGYINFINNMNVTPGSTLNITIGAGGTVGASVGNNSTLNGVNGNNGGSSSITISSNNLTYTVMGGQRGNGGYSGYDLADGYPGANGDDGLTDISAVNGVGGKTRFINSYFLYTSSVNVTGYGSGGNGGLGGDGGFRVPQSGIAGKPGYARIYFMKNDMNPTGGYGYILSKETVNNVQYNVMTFTKDGVFITKRDLSVKYMLIVAGGGSGGTATGGGGGAGGVGVYNYTTSSSSLTIPSGTNTVTIGSGGVFSVAGVNGNNTSISNGVNFTEIAYGGGGGGGGSGNNGNNSGNNYGSHGGVCDSIEYNGGDYVYNSYNKTNGITYYFNKGGANNIIEGNYSYPRVHNSVVGSGGGGAVEAGKSTRLVFFPETFNYGDHYKRYAGDGGNGYLFIDGNYYGGGGGGGDFWYDKEHYGSFSFSSGIQAKGGKGGGGNGNGNPDTLRAFGTDGTPNTGGGGGNGANGGSGIVKIYYL